MPAHTHKREHVTEKEVKGKRGSDLRSQNQELAWPRRELFYLSAPWIWNVHKRQEFQAGNSEGCFQAYVLLLQQLLDLGLTFRKPSPLLLHTSFSRTRRPGRVTTTIGCASSYFSASLNVQRKRTEWRLRYPDLNMAGMHPIVTETQSLSFSCPFTP